MTEKNDKKPRNTLGGYLRGPWWRYPGQDDETKTRRCFVAAWGNIVRDPNEKYRHNMRTARFIIKTGRGAGREEKHLVCVCYGETLSNTIVSALEKGDIVFLCGIWVETSWKTKKGLKPHYECRVGFIIPLGFVGFILELFDASARMTMGLPKFVYGLYMDEQLRQIAEKNAEKDDEADPWESDY